MTALAAFTHFCLPDWAHRTLVVAAPGRPLAPRPEAMARGFSLCPATAGGLLHPDLSGFAAWNAWSDAD